MNRFTMFLCAAAAAGWLLGGCSGDEPDERDMDPALGTAGTTAGANAAGVGGGAAGTAAGSPAAAGMSGLGRAGTGAAGSVGTGQAGRSGGPAGMAAPSPAGRGGMMQPAGGSAAPPATNPSECPAAPADATPQAVAALAAVNNYRVPAGAGCATMIAEINAAATAHCNYYGMYMSGDMCIANPHREVMGCAGFTGANPGDRMKAAGYTMFGGGEVMAFVNNAQGSVDTWVNSVWHRIPILDPFTTHLGYGNSAKCDTIDFARGTTPAPANTVVVYPYDGQTNVPISFNGQYEGPMPPAPPTGWPSSGPISVYAQKIAVTEHVLTLDGDPTPIEHVWLDSTAEIVAMDMRRSLTNVVFMYANAPFTPNTKYRVKISGSYGGGALAKEWTFTTGAAPTRPGRRP